MNKGLLLVLSILGIFTLGLAYLYYIYADSNINQGVTGISQLTGSRNLVESPIDNYYAKSSASSNILAAVGKSDSRPVIVDNFLAGHRSPMKGLGGVFVRVADKYGLDYRLMPAIAFQESILGKRIPKGSHNAWGWAIYTGESSGAKFKNWVHAIETVAQGLKSDYIDRGLTTPETIMTRYSDSEGSWAFGVRFAINEMTPK